MGVGTLGYMAPEQLTSGRVDVRTDIFAIGALAYELLTGSPAFNGESPGAIVSKIIHWTPPSVDIGDRDGAKSLAHFVDRCLQKDPDQRYQTVDAVRSAFASVAST